MTAITPAMRKALMTDTRKGEFSSATRDRLVKAGLIYDNDWALTPKGERVVADLKAGEVVRPANTYTCTSGRGDACTCYACHGG